MTPAATIHAGKLAMLRKELRDLALLRTPLILGWKDATGYSRTLYLDGPASRAALEAADLDLSDRLLKLGVSEHEQVALPPPDAGVPVGRDRPNGGRVPRSDRLPKRPQEDA